MAMMQSLARKLKAIDVIDILSDLFILHGIPAHIRSDNGTEFVWRTLSTRVYARVASRV
jgi:putative transposase